MKYQNLVLFTLILATLLLLTSCQREFDPYYRLDDFRILALRSSTPELRPGGQATLDALIFAPDQQVSYEWEWCPLRTSGSDGYECPFTLEELEALIAEESGVEGGISLPISDFSLGSEPTATLSYPAPQPLIAAFCQTLQEFLADAPSEVAGLVPVTDCRRGLDVSVRLIATTDTGKEIVAAKRVNLWLGSQEPNTNPRLTAMQIRVPSNGDARALREQGLSWVSTASDRDQRWHTIPEDETLVVYAGVGYELRTLTDPESIDVWRPPAPQGSGQDFLDAESEALQFRWFTTAGGISDSQRLWADGFNQLDEATITRLSIPAEESSAECAYLPERQAFEGCRINLYQVVRDGRLGIDWLERRLEVAGEL